jgi:hypothetical protein
MHADSGLAACRMNRAKVFWKQGMDLKEMPVLTPLVKAR